MIYLNNTDTAIIESALDVMRRHNGQLSYAESLQIDALDKLLKDSKEYSIERREKAKAIITEKRKTDKSYAHSHKRKKTS